MFRVVVRLVLDVTLTVAVALLLLGGWQSILAGSLAEGFPEALRVLFNFMDVGLGIWVVLLIVWAIRGGGTGPSAGWTFLLLLVGAILNLVVVAVVGFVQGGWAPLLVLFAIEAGAATLLAAAIVVPIVHRIVKSEAQLAGQN